MVDIRGIDKLRRVARNLRTAGDKTLQAELYAGLNRAVKPLSESVIKDLELYLPRGYAPLVAGSTRIRTTGARGRSVRVRVLATARGHAEKRDLAALNAGVLRHPVFGRHRFVKATRKSKYRDIRKANPWAVTAVRPGFFDDPARRLAADVFRECEGVIDLIAEKINGGL